MAHFFKNRELNELYLALAIRAFALAMIGIFVPIFLYKFGFAFKEIFLFYFFIGVVHIIFVLPAAKLSSKKGLKHSMLFSMIPLVIFFLFLYSMEEFNWPLYVLSFLVGMHTSLFWTSFHIDFSKFSDPKKRGMQVGFSKIMSLVFAALGPAVGGFLLFFFGFKFVFVLVSFLLILSIAPLFTSKEVHEPFSFSIKGFFKEQKFRDFISFIGHGIENKLGLVVWPLFIFVFILEEKYTTLGLVSSASFLAALIFTFAAGKFSDINRKLTLRIGIIFNSCVWIARSFVTIPAHVFVTDSFFGASQATMHVPFDATNYDKARKKERVHMIMQREIYHHIGSLLLFLSLILFVDSLIQVFRYAGPIASLMRFFF